MGLGRVQARGQVTIPAQVREAAGIRPGDTILFTVTGPGRGEFALIPTHEDLDHLLARFAGPGTFEAARVWEQVREDIARDVLEELAASGETRTVTAEADPAAAVRQVG